MAEQEIPQPTKTSEEWGQWLQDRKKSPQAISTMREHSDRIKQNLAPYSEPRLAPVDGALVAKELLKLVEEFSPAAGQTDGSAEKWQMFSEIVTRCAYDAAGNLNKGSSNGKKYNGFDEIFQSFAEDKKSLTDTNTAIAAANASIDALNERKSRTTIGYNSKEKLSAEPYAYGSPHDQQKLESESPYRKVLNYLPLYRKGMVQTPHPTEMLGRTAINAEIALHNAIESSPELFTKIATGQGSLSESQKGILKEKLVELFNTMKPITKPLTIEQEIKRSISFSELAFDAVPQMIQSVLDPAIRSGLRNTAPITTDELHHFSNLIAPSTWSPGDRDSKPDMTTERLAWGIEANKYTLSLQYAVKIAEILDRMGNPTTSDKEGHKKAYKELNTVFTRIVAAIPAKHLPSNKTPLSEDQKTVGDNFLEHYRSSIPTGAPKDIESQRRERVIAKIVTTSQHSSSVQAYASTEEMINAMLDVRHLQRTEGAKFPAYNDNHPVLNEMDVLVSQMQSFGSYALRTQIRESYEMHENVMQEVAKIPAVQEQLGNITNRKEAAEKIIDILGDPAQESKADHIRKAVREKIEDNQNQIKIIRNQIKSLNPQTEKDKVDELQDQLKTYVPLYETLGGMKLATQNPEAIPQYLIAECRDSTDILEAFALLKLVEPIKTDKRVEIVPLLEHREHVGNVAKMMEEVYQNKHFVEHQASISSNSPGIVREHSKAPTRDPNDPTKLVSTYDRITVAEMKDAYGIEQKEGDKTRFIDHTKMVMFAGSDIMKSAGPTGAALTQHAISDLRAKLLDLEKPVLLVDYVGSGGGIHRSQPVSTSFETTQGRSMRQTPTNIANKSIATMARFIKRMIGLKGKVQLLDEATGKPIVFDDQGIIPKDKIHLGMLAQLNLSNLAGFPTSEKFWNEETGKRNDAAMDSYQELYKSPEFASMLAFSADKFVKLTSYAARPLVRVSGSADTEEYPPIVDVEKLRAIGYGAALNVSGSSASLYFGVSKFLHADEILKGNENIEKLADLYLQDTKTQDVVNRATFGVVMADMNSAWKYLGKDRTVKAGGKVSIAEEGKDKNTTTEKLASLKTNKAAAAILERFAEEMQGVDKKEYHEKQMTWLGKLSLEDKHTLAVHSLARVDEEYQKVSKVLLRLHSIVTGKVPPEAEIGKIHDQILEKLPSALSMQINDSRRHISEARVALADQFLDSWQQNGHALRGSVKEVRDNKELFEPIYYRMGACNECFENAPRALSRPWWAVRKETEQRKDHAVSA